MFKSWVYSSVALVALFGFGSSANAAVVSLLQPGKNLLEDDDYELLVNAGGTVDNPGADTILNDGDFLAGIFQITSLYEGWAKVPANQTAVFPADSETFTGVFLLKVVASGGGPGAYTFDFAAATNAEWAAVGMPIAPVNDGTALILFDDPDNLDAEDTPVSDAIASVDGTKLYEFTSAFWSATGFLSNDVSDIPAIGGFGTFQAGLNVLERFNGAPQLAKLGPDAGAAFAPYDAAIIGGVDGQSLGDFDAGSDADLFINVVPEPTAIVVWSALGAIGLAFGWRRRRAA